MIDDPRPLSPRHERFVQEYLRDGNATQVAFPMSTISSRSTPRAVCIDLAKASRAQRAGMVALSITDHDKQWQEVESKLGKLSESTAVGAGNPADAETR